jgi:small-conductance mechanosensitive channel
MTFFRWRISLTQHLLALTLALFVVGATTAQAQAPSANPPVAAAKAEEEAVALEALWSQRLSAIEAHFKKLLATVPTLPAEFERRAASFELVLGQWTGTRFFVTVLLLLASGVATAFAFRRLTRRARNNAAQGEVTSVTGRLRGAALIAMLNLGEVVVTAVVVAAVFAALRPPTALGLIILLFMAASLGLYLVAVILRTAFGRGLPAETASQLALLPVSASDAALWRRRLLAFATIFLFGWVFAVAIGRLGAPPEVRQLVVYALGIGLVVLALMITWRKRPIADAAVATHSFGRLAMTAIVLVCWVAWVASAKGLLNFLLIGTVLYLAVAVERLMVRHLFRPVSDEGATTELSPVLVVAIDRILRAILIIAALYLLLDAWKVDFLGMVEGKQGPLERIVQAAAHALVIILLVDLTWSILNALIKKALTGHAAQGEMSDEAVQREARMRTLLPILRNIVGVILVVLGILMALAAFGVEIGPLIAGAGVVGVAVGFGAQTLVKDVFSGVFYLLDDAFRVGEYVQSGSYKGVVESFSLRSVKLRHHRGPLFTVPFGELGAIQNMSRDWVIDKMVISVDYGSDFDKAKKIVKQIGRELAEDAELGRDIIEPLKMQGVEEFGDYGVTIRLKMMTKPGKQFVLRRRANAMIKKRFDEAGIQFALPTIQVAGDATAGAAGAHQAMAAKAAEKPV